jgi:transcriptional regulator with XRE-family HTH domain
MTADQTGRDGLQLCISEVYALLQFERNPKTENPSMHETIRANIRSLMERDRIAHEKTLALDAGVEQSKLNRYLNHRIAEPGMEFFCKLADHFDVSLDQLVGRAPLPREDAPINEAYHFDDRTLTAMRVMEELPDQYKDALLASANALAASTKPR